MPRFADEVVSQPVLDFLRSGKLPEMIDLLQQLATTTQFGAVILANNGASIAGRVVQSNDSRLSNSRTPTTHRSSHEAGGGDSIKLDDLAAPDDTTDLDATTAKHGLMAKADKVKLDGIPSGGGGGMAIHIGASDPASGTGANGDIAYNSSTGGWLNKAAGVWTEFHRGPISITNAEARFMCPDGTERGTILTP